MFLIRPYMKPRKYSIYPEYILKIKTKQNKNEKQNLIVLPVAPQELTAAYAAGGHPVKHVIPLR